MYARLKLGTKLMVCGPSMFCAFPTLASRGMSYFYRSRCSLNDWVDPLAERSSAGDGGGNDNMRVFHSPRLKPWIAADMTNEELVGWLRDTDTTNVTEPTEITKTKIACSSIHQAERLWSDQKTEPPPPALQCMPSRRTARRNRSKGEGQSFAQVSIGVDTANPSNPLRKILLCFFSLSVPRPEVASDSFFFSGPSARLFPHRHRPAQAFCNLLKINRTANTKEEKKAKK